MSQVIMGNDDFYTWLIEVQDISALDKEATQTSVFMYSLSF